MSYSNGLNFLSSKTKVLELSNEFGARVAVCPLWNGRIMTSTCGGLEGDSYGLIDVQAIEQWDTDKSKASVSTQSFGGEDQFTLSPIGGPFSLYYETDSTSPISPLYNSILQDGIHIPSGFSEGPFEVDTGISSHSIRMRRSLSATNLSGAHFDLNVVRTVRLLCETDLKSLYPDSAVVAFEQPEVSLVSFETTNTLINNGAPFSRNSGLLSMRIRSMFNATPYSVMMLPYQKGDEDRLGPPVQSDFFGGAFHNRFHVLPQVAILRADGCWRGQIGVSRRRVMPFCAAVDFRAGVLSLVSFNLPSNPVSQDYLSNDFFESGNKLHLTDFLSSREFYINNLVAKQQAEEAVGETDSNELLSVEPHSVVGLAKEVLDNDPYSGEVVRAYNHGPVQPGEHVASPFFEFDTYSPAKELKKGESITHQQLTTHIYADSKTLQYLVKSIMEVDVNQVFQAVLT